MDDLEFRILGPFEVLRADVVVATGGGIRRAVLAALLLSANRAVPVAELIQTLWGHDPPRSATNLVQGYVSDWRSLLEPGRPARSGGTRLMSTPGAYRLRVASGELDASRLASHARQGRQAADVGDLLAARRLLATALAQWRGPAFVDFDQIAFMTPAQQLQDTRLAALEVAVEVELCLGHPERALGLLGTPSREHPLRESLTALAMLALYRAGRAGEALTTYEQARGALAEELGADPGPQLSALHRQILRHEPALTGPRPPARDAPSLPVPLTSFIGRERETTQVLDLVRDRRLVTLTGAAGSGKTRLATVVATIVAGEGDRTVAFADLSNIVDEALVWPVAAGSLGLRLAANQEPAQAFAAQLPREPVLLVLDNLEQLPTVAAGIGVVLSLASQLSVLSTSRNPVGVNGEQLFTVLPLPLPRPGVTDPAEVLDTAAVRLFVDRARSLNPAFEVAAADAVVAAGICRRVDGLPLALELTARWTATLSLRALLERLDRPLDMVIGRGGGGDRPARHRTLRAAIDWSYAALTDAQQRLLRTFSVFVGAAGLQAVEAVCALRQDTVPALADLVERHLVERTFGTGAPRYRLLVTIRDYAYEQLRADGDELTVVRERHAEYYCALAERASRAARSPQEGEASERLGQDEHEVRAALAHLRASGSHVRELALAVDCLALWWDLGNVREGYARITDALVAASGDAPDELVSAGNAVAAMLGEAAGQPASALDSATLALASASRAGSPSLSGVSRCLVGNGVAWMDWTGPATEGIEHLEVARRMDLEIPEGGLRWGWAGRRAVGSTATLCLVDVLRYRDPLTAAEVLASYDAKYPGRADAHTASFLTRAQGFLAADAGRWTEAADYLTRSAELGAVAGSRRTQSRTFEEQARLAYARNDLATAADLAAQATRISRSMGHVINWARCAALETVIAIELDEHDKAHALLDGAAANCGTGYPDLIRRCVIPLRARLARLEGRTAQAQTLLRQIGVLCDATGLNPERVIYLLEAASLARISGDKPGAVRMLARLDAELRRTGLVLPLPEAQRQDRLANAASGRGEDLPRARSLGDHPTGLQKMSRTARHPG